MNWIYNLDGTHRTPKGILIGGEKPERCQINQTEQTLNKNKKQASIHPQMNNL
jgi:hypothetical protein